MLFGLRWQNTRLGGGRLAVLVMSLGPDTDGRPLFTCGTCWVPLVALQWTALSGSLSCECPFLAKRTNAPSPAFLCSEGSLVETYDDIF